MKSVTNAKRSPFQAYRYGQEEGLRSSSLTRSAVFFSSPISVWRIPAGHSTLTASAAARGPRPKTRSAGAGFGVAA